MDAHLWGRSAHVALHRPMRTQDSSGSASVADCLERHANDHTERIALSTPETIVVGPRAMNATRLSHVVDRRAEVAVDRRGELAEARSQLETWSRHLVHSQA